METITAAVFGVSAFLVAIGMPALVNKLTPKEKDLSFKGKLMKTWIVIYDHRYGVDAWPIFSDDEPTVEQVVANLKDSEHTEVEFDRGETIEIRGPWKS
jgi:hypothetical protein